MYFYYSLPLSMYSAKEMVIFYFIFILFYFILFYFIQPIFSLPHFLLINNRPFTSFTVSSILNPPSSPPSKTSFYSPRSYEENKKKFWKESEEGWIENGRDSKGCKWTVVKRKRRAEYFDELLNVQEDRKADIVAVGGVQVPVMGGENEREITIEEVKSALNETKGGKAPGMDGVRVEMLKEGGVTVLEWLVRLFNI